MTRGTVAMADGGQLAYELSGAGTPVVLIHGFSLDMRSWDRQAAALALEHTVLRYDVRGFGASSRPTGPYDHADDLAGLLAALQVPAAHLVGLSLGANIALACAVRHPQLVRSLVLASSGLAGHPWTEPRPPDAAAEYARQHGTEAARAFWLGHALFAPVRDHDEARTELEAMVRDYSGWHWENVNPAAAFSEVAALPGIAAPTLVVSGSRDIAGYQAIARTLASTIPGARLLVIPDAGHMLTMEASGPFNAALLDFIRQMEQAIPLASSGHENAVAPRGSVSP